MKEYLEALRHVMDHGEMSKNRTGVDTKSVFGYQMRFDFHEGFPAVTTKKLAWKSVVSELLWFLEGSSDERRLAEILYGKDRSELTDKTTIWTANAKDWDPYYRRSDSDLGLVYGRQWRDWNTDHPFTYSSLDQVANLINGLKTDPNSRRHIITAWNPSELDQMALPPCHLMSQFHVNSDNELSCQMYQRSADLFLGVPFNIASYSLLTHMIAQVCGLSVGEFIWVGGDVHIYENHFDAVNEQLQREPKPLPELILQPDIYDIDKFKMGDCALVGYEHHPAIKADMAV
tara:strand:- start:2410 stop:3273 length:864 start_codon:yes stop_codon:yes gene_type:complete